MEIQVITDELVKSNCYLLEEEEEVLVIDPNDGERILQILEMQGLRLAMVILTHEHSDHISGLNRLREYYGPTLPVIASVSCSRNIQSAKMNLSKILGLYLFYLNGERCKDYPVFCCEPATHAFEKEMHMIWRGRKLDMFEVPGHSEGSIAVILDENFVFSGDSYLIGQDIVTGFPGENDEDYREKALPFFEKLPNACLIYPGHGEIFRRGDHV